MGFTASDLADWFDETQEDFSNMQDDWLIQSQQLNDAHPMIVFATWASNRISSAPARLQNFLAGSVVDVLRLGSDIDTNSGWGIAKGVVANVGRLAVVAGPAAKALGAGARYAGLIATATLDTLQGVSAPCRFAAVNNALSIVRGKSVQLFASLSDVVRIRSTAPSGANMIDGILRHPSIEPVLKDLGVIWTNLGNLPTVEAAVQKARQVQGAVVIGVEWLDTAGKSHAHRITLMQDFRGVVRFLDYSENATFKGFSSLAEMANARGGIWRGFENATIRPDVLLFQSKYLRFLETAGQWELSLPVAVGLRFMRGHSIDAIAKNIAMSFWEFIKRRLGDDAPAPPVPEILPAPQPPAQGGPPPEAANAPRSDWLTGVQYRLKYLAYYDGEVHGTNDRATKDAVIAFQTDQRIMIDGIPGPQTQAELVKVCGF